MTVAGAVLPVWRHRRKHLRNHPSGVPADQPGPATPWGWKNSVSDTIVRRQLVDFRHGVRQEQRRHRDLEFRAMSFRKRCFRPRRWAIGLTIPSRPGPRAAASPERYCRHRLRYRRTVGAEINSCLWVRRPESSGYLRHRRPRRHRLRLDDQRRNIHGRLHQPPDGLLTGDITVAGLPVSVVTADQLQPAERYRKPGCGRPDNQDSRCGWSIHRHRRADSVLCRRHTVGCLRHFEAMALVFTLTDGMNTYTFTLPKIKFTGGKPEVGGEREISISPLFQAIYAAIAPANRYRSGACLMKSSDLFTRPASMPGALIILDRTENPLASG